MNEEFSRQANLERVEGRKKQRCWEREFHVQKQETGLTGIVLGTMNNLIILGHKVSLATKGLSSEVDKAGYENLVHHARTMDLGQ